MKCYKVEAVDKVLSGISDILNEALELGGDDLSSKVKSKLVRACALSEKEIKSVETDK